MVQLNQEAGFRRRSGEQSPTFFIYKELVRKLSARQIGRIRKNTEYSEKRLDKDFKKSYDCVVRNNGSSS